MLDHVTCPLGEPDTLMTADEWLTTVGWPASGHAAVPHWTHMLTRWSLKPGTT